MTCRAKQCARTRQAWQRTCGRHSTYLTNISSPQGNGSCRKQEPRGFRKYVTLYDMITCLKHGSAHRAPTIVHTPCCADTGRESMDCRREPSRTGFGKSGLLKNMAIGSAKSGEHRIRRGNNGRANTGWGLYPNYASMRYHGQMGTSGPEHRAQNVGCGTS